MLVCRGRRVSVDIGVFGYKRQLTFFLFNNSGIINLLWLALRVNNLQAGISLGSR